MIELINIEKRYGNRVLFSNVNLKFDKPGIYSFVGDNGSGKSTLLNIIGGYIKPSKGKVINENIKISFMSQKTNLLDTLTIREMFKMLDLDVNLLRKVRLFSKIDKYPKELSLGMKQRIALIIALYSKASCIILDEPTSHLDLKNTKLIMREIKKVSENKIILLVNHNKEIVDEYSDFICVIDKGKISILKETKINRNLIIDRTNTKKKWRIYYKKSLKKNIKINLIFYFVFVLLFFIEFLSFDLKNNFLSYLENNEESSLDYNKFYLRQCEEIKEEDITLKKCINLDEFKVDLLKDDYNVVLNYDIFLNDLYSVNNLSVIAPASHKLKEGRYPLEYNEVVASSDYFIGDKIILESIKVINYKKTDIYKNKLVLNVVGIYENKPFIKENNLYLDYFYVDEYLKNEKLINNDVSLNEYYKSLKVSDYKYVLFFENINFEVLDDNGIDYLSASYEYYESLKESFKDIVRYFNYLNVSILITFIFYTFKLIKKNITSKERDILFFKASAYNKKSIIKLINSESVLLINLAAILSFVLIKIINYFIFEIMRFEIYFYVMLWMLTLCVNKLLVKREIRRRISI